MSSAEQRAAAANESGSSAEPAAWSRRPHALDPPHLLHVFPSFEIGGVPIRIANVINHYGTKYRHSIISLDRVTDGRSRLRKDLDLAFLPVTIDSRRPLGALRSIRRTLGTQRPDLLLTYNWGSVEWALVNSLFRFSPHIHFESGFGPEEADRQLYRRVILRRIALFGMRRLVAPSFGLVELATKTWKLNAKKVLHIPNGVDCALFAGPPEPGSVPGFTKSADELVIGTLAPLRAEKNLSRLIRVFAALQPLANLRLVVVGEGPERQKLTALAGTLHLGDRVIFSGNTDAPERVFGWFDVFVISSDTEQMPNTVLQAMAAARPIAGVDVGDIKRMVSVENRPFIVPKANEDQLCEAVRRLLGDPRLRAELGARNQAHVRAEYDLQKMFERYGALFDECLAATAG
jgi:glycosyltransferase involved in cell wall biosynthesis